ncbi:ribosomal protein S2, flavodoxin-like domain-containing protein [Obelidium mucronatum]|nr:ribosomal protein S2, flavodoxin-like domain-containing protein [Obelidium mucronatum]
MAQKTAHQLAVAGLMAAGTHLGHAAGRQHAHMTGFVFGSRGGVSVINAEHTLAGLRRAAAVARLVAARDVVFVGARRRLHALVARAALGCGAQFAVSLKGGALTNGARVLRRSLRFDPDKVAQPPGAPLTQPQVPLPALLVILDLNNNSHVVREANQLNIPIIAICDSDCDPNSVQYPIPANDDSLASVGLIADLLARAIREGEQQRRNLQPSRQQHAEDEQRLL